MSIMEHGFTPTIFRILKEHFGDDYKDIFNASQLLQYLNFKTKSAAKGSKSRGAFANHYAIYVLIEDYLGQGFDTSGKYSAYDGARYTDLFRRQRQLPFGAKLQNHGLNGRMNDEFRKFFPGCSHIPIMRNDNKYWINENLLVVEIAGKRNNIAKPIIKIIDAYVAAKMDAFDGFIAACLKLQQLEAAGSSQVKDFITSLVQPNVDARIFEIVSFGILKNFYSDQILYWGWSRDELKEDNLTLYKTGRTNANDGGIDFVMRPLGRFFQVTETTDVRKYFLDIDKVQRFPITFVVKSAESAERLSARMRSQAREAYGVDTIVNRYMECVEEIINIPTLLTRFAKTVADGKLNSILNEIMIQSKVEFNYNDAQPDDGTEEPDETE